MLPIVKLEVNRKGGLYLNGSKLPSMFRERVLDLHHANFSQHQIANLTRTSRHFVRNVVRDYDITNSSLQPPKSAHPRPKMTPDVAEFIEHEKLLKPSTCLRNTTELVLDGVVHPLDVPSTSAIKKCIKSDLLMSHKKLTVTPLESTTDDNIDRTNMYLDQVSDLNPATLHFFRREQCTKNNR